jgi:ribonuclease D
MLSPTPNIIFYLGLNIISVIITRLTINSQSLRTLLSHFMTYHYDYIQTFADYQKFRRDFAQILLAITVNSTAVDTEAELDEHIAEAELEAETKTKAGIDAAAELELEADHPPTPAHVLGMDMEFYRHDHYIPQLTLLQIKLCDRIFIIDGLRLKKHMRALLRYIAQLPDMMVVFHAPEQDLSIYYHIAGQLPEHIFDTQLAERFLRVTPVGGYGGLVQQYFEEKLDKSSQFQDWRRRPLDQKSLNYAAQDVVYLKSLYEKQKSLLQKNGKWSFFHEEMQRYLTRHRTLFALSSLADLNAPRAAHSYLQPWINALLYKRFIWAKQMDISQSRLLKNDDLYSLYIDDGRYQQHPDQQRRHGRHGRHEQQGWQSRERQERRQQGTSLMQMQSQGQGQTQSQQHTQQRQQQRKTQQAYRKKAKKRSSALRYGYVKSVFFWHFLAIQLCIAGFSKTHKMLGNYTSPYLKRYVGTQTFFKRLLNDIRRYEDAAPDMPLGHLYQYCLGIAFQLLVREKTKTTPPHKRILQPILHSLIKTKRPPTNKKKEQVNHLSTQIAQQAAHLNIDPTLMANRSQMESIIRAQKNIFMQTSSQHHSQWRVKCLGHIIDEAIKQDDCNNTPKEKEQNHDHAR